MKNILGKISFLIRVLISVTIAIIGLLLVKSSDYTSDTITLQRIAQIEVISFGGLFFAVGAVAFLLFLKQERNT